MKKWLGQIILIIIVAVVTSLLVVHFISTKQKEEIKSETVYDRIMRTRTIRCTYLISPPYITKDLNTGKLSGLYVDFMDALSAITDLKIEWAQELNISTYLQDLEAGRYDMECASGWANAKRGQFVFYSKPYAYIPLVAVVRAGDRRFDDDSNKINNPQIKIATMDGETTSVIRRLRFPLTQDLSVPQNSPINQMFLNVADGKADVTFYDAFKASLFIKANPDKAEIIRYNSPIFMIALSPSLPPDIRLKQMMDVATDQLLNSGKIEEILRKYETEPNQFLRVSLPYHNQ